MTLEANSANQGLASPLFTQLEQTVDIYDSLYICHCFYKSNFFFFFFLTENSFIFILSIIQDHTER